jgi:hypothetical protein
MFASPMIKNGEGASGHSLKFIGEARCPTFGSGAAFLLFCGRKTTVPNIAPDSLGNQACDTRLACRFSFYAEMVQSMRNDQEGTSCRIGMRRVLARTI